MAGTPRRFSHDACSVGQETIGDWIDSAARARMPDGIWYETFRGRSLLCYG